jgi:hypothetical protein
VHIELDRNMTLDKVHETLTLIRNSVSTDFKAEDAVVISPSPCNCEKHAAQVSMGMSEEEEKPTLEDYESKDKGEKWKYIIYLAQIDKFECF